MAQVQQRPVFLGPEGGRSQALGDPGSGAGGLLEEKTQARGVGRGPSAPRARLASELVSPPQQAALTLASP